MTVSGQKTFSAFKAAVFIATALGASGSWAMAAAPVCTPAAETHIFLGGISGTQPLADPQSSAAFRAGAGTGYYLHYSMFAPSMTGGLTMAEIKEIARNFAGRPAMAEIGLFHPGFFQQEWRKLVLASGFKPDWVAVNLTNSGTGYLSDQALADFTRLSNEGFAENLKMVAPVITPNSYGEVSHVFSDPYWDTARRAALQGRGIVMDTPPEFYLREWQPPRIGRQYRAFIREAVHWARANKITSVIILSPRKDAGKFKEDAIAEREDLHSTGSLPDFWVFENYTKNDATPVGSDTDPESIAGTASWFAANPVGACTPP